MLLTCPDAECSSIRNRRHKHTHAYKRTHTHPLWLIGMWCAVQFMTRTPDEHSSLGLLFGPSAQHHTKYNARLVNFYESTTTALCVCIGSSSTFTLFPLLLCVSLYYNIHSIYHILHIDIRRPTLAPLTAQRGGGVRVIMCFSPTFSSARAWSDAARRKCHLLPVEQIPKTTKTDR